MGIGFKSKSKLVLDSPTMYIPNRIKSVILLYLVWASISHDVTLHAQGQVRSDPELQNQTGGSVDEQQTSAGSDIRLDVQPTHVEVSLGDSLFARFQHSDEAKPYFYPVLGPGQVSMTRHWPLDKSHTEEPVDHPHHKALWFSHIINGIDFWSEHQGSVKVDQIEIVGSGLPTGHDTDSTFLRVTSSWRDKSDDSVVLTDQSVYRFGADENHRWIDATIEFRASHGPVVFEDTKEGTFAIRVPPSFQFDSQQKRKFPDAVGSARNSSGQVDSDIWGQAAKWVVYLGLIDDQRFAIAMFDHPSNLRHPTTWHARDYGLFAANPFGLHDFKREPKGSGQHRLAEGETLQLRYRVLFIADHPTDQQLEKWYQDF